MRGIQMQVAVEVFQAAVKARLDSPRLLALSFYEKAAPLQGKMDAFAALVADCQGLKRRLDEVTKKIGKAENRHAADPESQAAELRLIKLLKKLQKLDPSDPKQGEEFLDVYDAMSEPKLILRKKNKPLEALWTSRVDITVALRKSRKLAYEAWNDYAYWRTALPHQAIDKALDRDLIEARRIEAKREQQEEGQVVGSAIALLRECQPLLAPWLALKTIRYDGENKDRGRMTAEARKGLLLWVYGEAPVFELDGKSLKAGERHLSLPAVERLFESSWGATFNKYLVASMRAAEADRKAAEVFDRYTKTSKSLSLAEYLDACVKAAKAQKRYEDTAAYQRGYAASLEGDLKAKAQVRLALRLRRKVICDMLRRHKRQAAKAAEGGDAPTA